MHSNIDQDLLTLTEDESLLSLLWDDVRACGIHSNATPSGAQRRQFSVPCLRALKELYGCLAGDARSAQERLNRLHRLRIKCSF
jgi:hypothetical protein